MSVLYVIPDAMDAFPDLIMHTKLILLAHGSRDNNWCQTFENGLKIINQRLDQDATLAYMEMATPSFENVVSTYYLQGIKKVRVLPLFFAAGRHLLHDVPEKISDLQSNLEGLEIELLKNVGEYEEFWYYLGDLISKECSTENLLSSNQ
jgi:sirohydrochlorin cobaltochelatase